jgi:hypothetical protein
VKRITFIEFESGDPMPDWVTSVTDNENSRWERGGDLFVYPDGGMMDQDWSSLLSAFGPVRAVEPDADAVRTVAYELRCKAESLIVRADAMILQFGIKE